MQPRIEALHGRHVVITAIFHAGRGDADRIQFLVGQQVLYAVVGAHAILGCGCVGPLLNDVADGDQLTQVTCMIDRRMVRATDIAHSDDGDFEHTYSPLL